MIRKRKLLIITGIYPPDIGGPATFSKELLNYFSKKKYIVKVITLSNIKKIFLEENNVTKIRRDLPKVIRTLLLIYHINKSINKSDNLLVCGLILESYIGSFGKSLSKKVYRFVGDSIWEKYVASQIKRDFKIINNSLKINLLIKFRNYLIRSFDLIVTPSNFLKNYLVKNNNIDKNKIKVISNFVILKQKIKPINVKRKKIINVVSISRLVPWKNLDLLIKAVKNLDFIKLNIVGSGPEKANLSKLIRSENIKNVSLLGVKDKSNAIKILNDSDCFIQISSYEGMSFSILEAIKLNKPMILSNIEPNFETAKSSAIYVNYKSSKEIINALRLISSFSVRDHLSKITKSINKEIYDYKDSLNKYEDILI